MPSNSDSMSFLTLDADDLSGEYIHMNGGDDDDFDNDDDDDDGDDDDDDDDNITTMS